MTTVGGRFYHKETSPLAGGGLTFEREGTPDPGVGVSPGKKSSAKGKKGKPAPRHWWSPFAQKPAVPREIPLRKLIIPAGQLSFICDICGNAAEANLEQAAGREIISCQCGSTLRFRAIVAALQERLFGEVRPLRQLPKHKEIKGVGMSETGVYCHLLAEKFDYLNTFLDRKPILDILDPAPEYLERSDFVICSDVVEHVQQPIELAFQNLRRLLRPGGTFVFTVPYSLGEGITEHFPDLYSYEITGSGDETCLVNTSRTGEKTTYRDIRFHGGHGSVLEMRLFSLGGVLQLLHQSGFRDIRIHDDHLPRWGIVNLERTSHPITAIAG